MLRESNAKCKRTERKPNHFVDQKALAAVIKSPKIIVVLLCFCVHLLLFIFISALFLSSRVLHHSWTDFLKFENMIDFDIYYFAKGFQRDLYQFNIDPEKDSLCT